MAGSGGTGRFLGLMDDADGSVGVGLIRPRELQFVDPSEDTDYAEGEEVLVIAEHLDQSEYEFVAKLSIACVLLAGLLVWFFWSFWWEKNMRRRVVRSRRRNSLQGSVVRPQSSGSHDSARVSGGDTSPSTQGYGAGAGSGSGSGYQRDAYAFGRDAQEPPQQVAVPGPEQETAAADQTIKEFINPLWGKSNGARGDRPSGFRERSVPPDPVHNNSHHHHHHHHHFHQRGGEWSSSSPTPPLTKEKGRSSTWTLPQQQQRQQQQQR